MGLWTDVEAASPVARNPVSYDLDARMACGHGSALGSCRAAIIMFASDLLRDAASHEPAAWTGQNLELTA